jgi:site-specific DNA recombinase
MPTLIAAIYARKSTDQNGVAEEAKSVTRQIEHAKAYAARKGWTVDERSIYVDDGISGAEFANRPGFMRLMNALKPRPSFNVLVMSEESRLGREAIETAYALKQLVTAGVRVFFYLEDRERTLDSPTDKIMLSLTTFADELEREKARQRTRDAMVRKAQAGHVTGGACFGYRNVEIIGPDGKRSHVEREIHPTEADVIRRIFRLSAEGYGLKAIAKRLNADGVVSPRAQLGRSQTWAPTSVRAVLTRPLYRGEIVWAQTAKRDKWGRKHQQDRPESEWIRTPAPALRIVSDEEWRAAHTRQQAAKAIYTAAGRRGGRPPLGNPSKYLLTNLASCGVCEGPLEVISRSHGETRKHFYGCAYHVERGICENNAHIPMEDADGIVLDALLDDVLDDSIITEAIDVALGLIQTPASDRFLTPKKQLAAIETELATVNEERARLVTAIAAGGQLDGLLSALQERETRRATLQERREQLRAERGRRASDVARAREELVALAASWRRVLADDPTHARPIVASLLKGRVIFAPLEPSRWRVCGEGSLIGLFSREVAGRGNVPNGKRDYLQRLLPEVSSGLKAA